MITPEKVISKDDVFFMSLALQEARKGLGRTSPNPCVGAVIVVDNEIVSSGYHKKAGTPHAEVHALRKAGSLAKDATIYVTLEPCNHTGRTPPCSHAIVAAGIKRVVVGLVDPNPIVNGSGNSYLRGCGIEVVSGILEKECLELNRPFIKHITTGKPFVVMKAGMSLDGRLSYQDGVTGQMTGIDSKTRVHSLRDSFDAILIGSGTLAADDPSLTTRLGANGRDPLRVVLDSFLSITLDSRILHLQSNAETLLFCSSDCNSEKRAQLEAMEGVSVRSVSLVPGQGLDLEEVLEYLGAVDVCSLLVEGGAAVHGSFLRQELVDRVMLFVAPLFAGSDGTPLLKDFRVTDRYTAPKLNNVSYEQCGADLIIQGDLF